MRSMLLVALLAACTSSESTGISDGSCPTGSTLTYETLGAAFFAGPLLVVPWSKENPVLSTQAQIQAQASRILDEAVYTTAMPEDADLDNEERARLGEWLACGAP